MQINQNKTPILDALRRYAQDHITSFHVPGHKHGRGLKELRQYLGRKIFNIDLTLMPELDSIFAPQGVIKEAEELTAGAFGADAAYFIVNGTTAGIQGMIMAACHPDDKIIVPRNVHKSVFGALILSGAEPIYVPAELNSELGIAMGVELEQVEHAMRDYPEAKAVFLLNPTYYGMASDLSAIVATAHDYDMAVLVDEAHGAHFSFHPLFPLSSMEAGADLAALSIH
ncbi:MAG: aminotransferase class I/II-fold pyridoxal phosphate-dependent enzyme, partial [bacterium]